MLFWAGLFAQTEYSLNRDTSFVVFKKGMKIEFYADRISAKPSGGFIIADSAAYLISSISFRKVRFLQDKNNQLEGLIHLQKLKIENLSNQKKLLEKQLETEQKALANLREISQRKSEVGKEAIGKLRAFRRKGVLFSSFVGLVGGLLWTRKTDSGLTKIIKPAFVTGSALVLSFALFR